MTQQREDAAPTERVEPPFVVTRVKIMNVDLSPGAPRDERWFDSASEALAEARTWLCRRAPHIALEAHSGNTDTFAIRHLTLVDGLEGDTGWRCWIDGAFAGPGEAE